MEKKVFCLIGERCKCIKYFSENNTSDCEVIRRKLLEASKNDAVLNMMISGKSIILQKKDPDRDNKECDIEDEDVPDKSDVIVVLIPRPPIASSSTSLPIIIPGDLGVGEKAAVEMDLGVLYTEPPHCDPDEEIVIQQSLTDAPAVTTYRDSESLGVKNTNAAKDAEADSSGNGKFQSTSSKSRKLPPSTGPGSILQTASLPPLTLDLERKLADVGILHSQKYFIHHWGSYLWQATKTMPSKQDYYNLASSIVAAYPSLSGGQNGCGIVKSQLSIWIRNHRANLKKQATKTCNPGEAKLIPVAQATIKSSESVPTTHTDIQNALKELQKKICSRNEHIALEETFTGHTYCTTTLDRERGFENR